MSRHFRRFRILLPQQWHTRRLRWNARSGRSARLTLCAAAILLGIWILVSMIGAHIRPIVSQMAESRANYLATTAINDAIVKRLGDGEYTYDQLIDFEKDGTGRITALKTDMLAINRLKSDIIHDVLNAVQNIGTSELGIPLGNVTGLELFSGRGPTVPVKIVPIGTAGADFSNVFTSAGINQTRHQVIMTIQADISVLMPGHSTATHVSVQVAVAETVIVGTVPDTYANIGGNEK